MAREAVKKMEVRDYTKELEAAAVDSVASSVQADDFNSIGTRGGVLTYKNIPVPGNEMEVCILDFIQTNLYFPGVYVEGESVPPACYAFGKDAASMKPHPACAQPQHDNCKSCPHNQYGSSATGASKACQNAFRLALVLADSLEALADEPVAMLKVPVTSAWAGKNKTGDSLSEIIQKYGTMLKLPPFAMTTIIRGQAGQLKKPITFHAGVKIEDSSLIGAILEKRKTIIIDAPFSVPAEVAAPAKAEERKPNRFARK